MADYPEWVLNFKEKGTYIKHTKDKHYLYRGHSERISGTKKVRFICDEYLGRITEENGLIPSRDKVSGIVTVYDYGMPALILAACPIIYMGLRKSFTKNGDFVMAASILNYLYGRHDIILFQNSWLCLRFPELDFTMTVSDAQELGIVRGYRMLTDTMNKVFGNDLPVIKAYFSQYHKVKINEKLYSSARPEEIQVFLDKYNLRLEEY